MGSKIKNFFGKIKDKVSPKYQKMDNSFKTFFDKYLFIILIVAVTAIAILIRIFAIKSPTNDTAGIVFSWMDKIEETGFANFWKIDADYSLLYLFLIAIMTLLPKGDLITIGSFTFYANRMFYLKSLLYLIEIGMAIGVFLVILKITKSKIKSTIGYCITMLLPVQYLNSAIWGNCDCMYFVCFIFILYFVLTRKDRLVWLIMGFALGVKLQSVFILPLLVYLCLSKKLTFYKIIYILPGYLITVLPAYCCGCPFLEGFSYIGVQMTRWGGLTYGCANLWHLIYVNNGMLDMVNKASTWIGLGFIGLFMAILLFKKIELTEKNILMVATFSIGIVPFFLPHMHERYFYALDILVVLYALVRGKRYWLIVLMQFSSLIAYCHYLSGKFFIDIMGEDSVNIATVINIFVLGFIFYEILTLKPEEEKPLVEAVQ